MGGWARIFSGLILSLPGIFLGVLATLAFSDEYFYLPYLVFSLVLAGSALISGALLVPGSTEKRFFPVFLRMAAAAGLAAIFALVVFAALNLTPLCVGQDNGDGTNDLLMGVVQTGLVTVVFGPVVVGLLALATLLDSLLVQKSNLSTGS